MSLRIILCLIFFETYITSQTGFERVAGTAIFLLSLYSEVQKPSRSTLFLFLLMPLLVLTIYSPVFASYFFVPLLSFRLGLRYNIRMRFWDQLFFIAFISAPFLDLIFRGASDFGKKTGYFFLMKEGNVVGYLLLVCWILLSLNIKSRIKFLILVFFGLVSAFLSGSNVYLLGVIIFGLLPILSKGIIILLIPVYYYLIWPILVEGSFQFRAIIWRIQSGEFTVIDALLSGRVSNFLVVLNDWGSLGYMQWIFGDLFISNEFYVEMDVFLGILKLGFLGMFVFAFLFYRSIREMSMYNWNRFGYYFIMMFGLVGHGLFRPVSMMAFGILISNAHSTNK